MDSIAKDLKPGTLFWRKELLSSNTQGITFSLLLLQLIYFLAHITVLSKDEMREASKKLGDEKLKKILASMQHKQLDFKLAEVAIYDRGSDFLLAWTGALQSKREVRRMFHLPDESVEDLPHFPHFLSNMPWSTWW